MVLGRASRHRRRNLLLPAGPRARHSTRSRFPEAYNAVIGTYKTPIMAFGEIALVAAIAFHAFNGLRVILIDFSKGGPKNQKKLFWGVMILWLIVMVAFVPRQLMHTFGG